MINYQKRQKLIAQALNEITFARNYKQGKVQGWKVNEDLYYPNNNKRQGEYSRANVDLGKAGGMVHTILSKIDNPLVFKFTKRKKAQTNRVKMLNALREYDANRDAWDIKDLVGKKQAVIYGRAIYMYYADSENGYQPHLTPIDVYDYLIDPSAGGIDIDQARYMGVYGVRKNKAELKKGIKDGIYLKTETEELISGSGNSIEETQEETNKLNRTSDQKVQMTNKEIGNPDEFKFWHWFTTFEGERYHLVLTERGSTAIMVEPLTDMFPATKKYPLGPYPIWTWAPFPDLTEFWTPSYIDYERDKFMAQAISINQMLDNAEQINKPQRIVNIAAIEDLAALKYRRDGIIPSKGTYDVNKVIQELRPQSINTPIAVYNLLDDIQGKTSGVNDATQGVAEQDKVGIYEGDQRNTADRFGLLNKSYSFGYDRFAYLYEQGVKQHLKKKVSIDILGPEGVEMHEINKSDIYRKDDEFGIIVESSTAELALSGADKNMKLTFLSNEAMNPVQNQEKAYEIKAGIAGFDTETIKELMDTSEFGDESIMAEAERDIERILDGKKFKPNQAANNAYKQRFVDYMIDHEEDIDFDTFQDLEAYIMSLDPIIYRNMTRKANDQLMKKQMEQLGMENPTQVGNSKDTDISMGIEPEMGTGQMMEEQQLKEQLPQ